MALIKLLVAPIRRVVNFPLFQLAAAIAVILFLQAADSSSVFGRLFSALDYLVDLSVSLYAATFQVRSFTKSWLTTGFMIAYVYIAGLLIRFHNQHPNLGFQEPWKPVWNLSPGVPIGCRSPRKRGPYSMPIHRQLFGYGRSDRSSKAIRGIASETAAGVRSRREMSNDDNSSPVSSHNAPFPSYKTARFHCSQGEPDATSFGKLSYGVAPHRSTYDGSCTGTSGASRHRACPQHHVPRLDG